ncbi:MAG: phosphate acyltransferase PlsX [Chloroflexota bacterium]
MKIVLDAMGGDRAPAVVVEGAVQAAREYGAEIILVGRQDTLEPELEKYDLAGLSLPIVHASQVVEMEEHTLAVKEKKDSSLNVGMKLVQAGQAQAFVSAGNSGAVMAAALFNLGRIKGIERPALGTVYPTVRGKCFLLDIGVNTDCKPEYLLQFAIMGSAYWERVFGVPNPRVGLVSNGEEEGKGSMLARDAYQLLKQSELNFVGNVEGKDVPLGLADVAVTDGFTGNVMIKLSEGVAEMLVGFLKEEIKKRPLATAGAMLAKPAFEALRKRLDYSEYGGGPLLGVDGVVIVAHGRSNAYAIKNAVRVAKEAVDRKLVEAIREGVR